MKKADPVSSKSLYRCLHVLDVFVHLYYSKKDVFCQDVQNAENIHKQYRHFSSEWLKNSRLYVIIML